MTWAEGPLLAFDLETTGVDVENDRLVTASVVEIQPGRAPVTRTWLADPGIAIPAEATAVHGISTEHARCHGHPIAGVVEQVHAALAASWRGEVPLVGFNAAFDVSLLDREVARHHTGAVAVTGSVVDPLVIDRGVDRYRPGRRTLAALCAHYGIALTRAHTADADALAAARLAWKLARAYPEQVGDLPVALLHEKQQTWHRDWAFGFADYLHRRGNTDRAVELRRTAEGWPLRPRPIPSLP